MKEDEMKILPSFTLVSFQIIFWFVCIHYEAGKEGSCRSGVGAESHKIMALNLACTAKNEYLQL